MKSIVIVQTILPHYRSSVFHLLVRTKGLRFNVLAGKANGVLKEMVISDDAIKNSLNNSVVQVGGHHFIFQSGIFSEIKALKPDCVVLGGPDIHIVSNLLLFLYLRIFTKTEVHWWTHGVSSKQSILRAVQILFIKFSNGVLTYEEVGKNTIIQLLKANSIKVTVLKNAINTEDYGFSRHFNHKIKTRSTFNILFSGRLTHSKRCDILVEALALLSNVSPHFRLDIVGAGEALPFCKQLAEQHGITESVTFHGELYGSKLEHIFLQSDIFVLPGKVGLSAIHALSYGLPVLTTNAPIHSPEVAIIEQGVNGDFFDQFSISSLANLILAWSHRQIDKAALQAMIMEKGYTPTCFAHNMVEHFTDGVYI